MPYAFRTLQLLFVTALALCMTLGTLGNASAAGLLGFSSDDSCGEHCPCEGEPDEQVLESDHASAHDTGESVSTNTDCEDDCPNCGSVRHAQAGLPNAPVLVGHHTQALCRAVAAPSPRSPLLDDPSGVFRPPRAATRPSVS